MRVPDAFLRAVTFIGCRINGKPFKGGTAFFIGSDGGGAVVIARHNIEAIRNKSDDGKVLMWLNRLEWRRGARRVVHGRMGVPSRRPNRRRSGIDLAPRPRG